MKILISKIKMTYLLAPLLAFFAPVGLIVLLVGMMIAIDTCFGVWKAKKLGQPITSREFSSIVGKMILYQGAILLFFALNQLILGDFIMLFTSIPMFLVKIVAAVLVGIELGSINENWKAVKGYSLWDKAKDVLKRAKDVKKEIEDFKEEK